jgi:hypothetical protein
MKKALNFPFSKAFEYGTADKQNLQQFSHLYNLGLEFREHKYLPTSQDIW